MILDWGDESQEKSFGKESLCAEKYPSANYSGLLTSPLDHHHEYK